MNTYVLTQTSAWIVLVLYIAMLAKLGLLGVAIQFIGLWAMCCLGVSIVVFGGAAVKYWIDTRPRHSTGVIIPTHVEIVR
jgi:hypothetical protein